MPDLLIQFNGADAATSYTAETGQTVTFNGTAQLDTAQKKNGLSSLLLDGNSDYVTVPDSASWTLGSNWTCEGYFHTTTTASSQALFSQRVDGNNEWVIEYLSTKIIRFYSYDAGESPEYQGRFNSGDLSSVLTQDAWHHIAITRDGSNAYLHIDGQSQTFSQQNAFSAMTNFPADLEIGASGGGTLWNGWIDNIKITNGTSLYGAADFEPPMPDSYFHAKCNDDAANTTVTDDGAGGNNGTSSTNTSNLSVTGSSAKINEAFEFNGSSEYINIDTLEQDIDTDTSGSISAWIYPNNLTSNMTIFSLGDTDADRFFRFGLNNQGKVEVYLYDAADDWYHLSSSALALANDWYHLVVVQDGVSPKVYLNTVDVTNLTISTDTTQWFAGLESSGPLDNGRIGCVNNNSGGNSRFFDGIIDDFRYYKNIALTEQDVKNIYNRGNGTEDDPAPFVGALAFNQAVIIAA